MIDYWRTTAEPPTPGAKVLMRASEDFTDQKVIVNGTHYEVKNRLVEVDACHAKLLYGLGFWRVF